MEERIKHGDRQRVLKFDAVMDVFQVNGLTFLKDVITKQKSLVDDRTKLFASYQSSKN